MRRQQKGRLDALLCPQREPTKGVRRQQKGSKKAGRAGRDRASALKTVPCRCLSAFPGRARLPTAKRGHSNATLGTRPRRSRLPAHSFGSCSLRRSKCAWAGREAVLAGRALGTDSFLAAEQAAGALLWFVLAAAKRVRPPSALDAKLFLLVAPWKPIAVYFLYRIQK